jgi:hypothetical protein
MTDSDQLKLHAVLYAKGHYQYDKTLAGLRKIVSDYSLMDVKYIDDEHLMHFVLMLLETYAPNTKFDDLILEPASVNRGTISQLDVVEGILSRLRHMRVDELPPLPVADAAIAPLKEK